MPKQIVIIDGKDWPIEDILSSPSLMHDIILALSNGHELPVKLHTKQPKDE